MRRLTIASVLCAWVTACGGSDTPDGSKSQPPGSQPSGSRADGGGSAGPEGPSARGASTAALDVVFNEVAAVGPSEWIEIANKGDASIDLGDYYLADSDKATKEPKKRDAMRFPAGTTMAPRGRIVIVASKKNGTVGPHPKADCLPNGPNTCFFASFGVSATTGEPLHLLAPDGSVVTSTALPRTLSADAGGSTLETQCRLPDLVGDFAPCAPTPGQANVAP
jgi:hypothetical protein